MLVVTAIAGEIASESRSLRTKDLAAVMPIAADAPPAVVVDGAGDEWEISLVVVR